MTFVNPSALLLLLPAAALMVWRYRRFLRRRLAVPTLRLWRLALDSSEGGVRVRRRLPLEILLEALALTAAIFAASDPRIEQRLGDENKVIVRDVGGAMNAAVRRDAASAAIMRLTTRQGGADRTIEVPAADVLFQTGDAALAGPFDIARNLATSGARVSVVTDDELPANPLPAAVDVIRVDAPWRNAGIVAASTDTDSQRLFVSVGRSPTGPREGTLRVTIGQLVITRNLDLAGVDRAEHVIELDAEATKEVEEIAIGIDVDDDWAEDDACILTRIRGSRSILVDAELQDVAAAAEAAGYRVTMRSRDVKPLPSAIAVTRDEAGIGAGIVIADPHRVGGPFGDSKSSVHPRVSIHYPALADLDTTLFVRTQHRAVVASEVEALVSLDDDVVIARERATRRVLVGLDLTNEEIAATVDFPRLFSRLLAIAGAGITFGRDREFDVVACCRPLEITRRDPAARLRRLDASDRAPVPLPDDTLALTIVPLRPGRYAIEDRFGAMRFSAAVLSSTETMRVPAASDVLTAPGAEVERRSLSLSGVAAATFALAALTLFVVGRRRARTGGV